MKINKEGLTFKEWVCAAGVAVIDDGSVGVKPYSSSGLDLSSSKRKRWYRTHYSKAIRKAWLAGEDPTEYRV